MLQIAHNIVHGFTVLALGPGFRPRFAVLAGIWPGYQVSSSRFHCYGARPWVTSKP